VTAPGVTAPRVFEADYRVRFDEAGADGMLRDSGHLRYMQDVAWRHSSAAGFDREWYRDRGLLWLVRSLTLEVREPVHPGDELAVATTVIGWRRVWARRRAEARRSGTADPVAVALIDWVLLDHRGRPSAVPEEIRNQFADGLQPFQPVRVTLPDDQPTVARQPLTVSAADLDPMGHVNNARYLDYLVDAWGRDGPRDALPRSYSVEYLRPAEPDARLLLTTGSDEGGSWAGLTNASGVELMRARGRP
jgi:medium-chain acyl-[acyl-carrier-protein] hydrolase